MTTPLRITRRSFAKTSAFTAALLLVLSQGIALANPEGASGSDGTGCKDKTTQSFDNQKEKTLRTDLYTKYKKTEAPNSEIWVVQPGTVTQAADSKMPPGDYGAEYVVNVGTKKCTHTRDNSAPVTTTVSDTGWVMVGNGKYTPLYTALPENPTQWNWLGTSNVDFTREIVWDSVQTYILLKSE